MRVDPNGEGWILLIALVGILVVTLTSCSPKISEDDINLYSDEEGTWQEGKINVKFSPNSDNPSFQIENSCDITNSTEQEFILNYIVNSDFYDQDVYCRTVNSMLIEWDMHNFLYRFHPIERLAHTDFDKQSEGWTKIDYLKFAKEEYFNEKK